MNDDNKNKELICQVFIDSINHYFEQVTKEISKTGMPYIKEEKEEVLDDYVAMIGISGSRKGFVYVTGKDTLFRDLLSLILKLDDPSSKQLMDMAGDIANTISGNVREVFGSDFMISVPAVIEGDVHHLSLPGIDPVYVIPINWKTHEFFVVIGLK